MSKIENMLTFLARVAHFEGSTHYKVEGISTLGGSSARSKIYKERVCYCNNMYFFLARVVQIEGCFAPWNKKVSSSEDSSRNMEIYF